MGCISVCGSNMPTYGEFTSTGHVHSAGKGGDQYTSFLPRLSLLTLSLTRQSRTNMARPPDIPLSRYVAIGAAWLRWRYELTADCEMVRTRTQNALARLSPARDWLQANASVGVVDHAGNEVYHSFAFIHPHDVLDYNTPINGITEENLVGGESYLPFPPQPFLVLPALVPAFVLPPTSTDSHLHLRHSP